MTEREKLEVKLVVVEEIADAFSKLADSLCCDIDLLDYEEGENA